MAALPQCDYVVVVDAISDVRFPEGGTLTISDLTTPVGKATFWFSTRYEDRGFEATVPRELVIEITGSATATLNETINIYANTALGLIPVISLAANAAIDDPQIRLAYDSTNGRTEREFFQRFVTELEPEAVRFGKPADREAIALLFGAIATHGEQERLHRAAEQYRQALLNWSPGHEAMSIAHLWIAVEALTKVALRRDIEAARVANGRELADRWGVDIKALDGEVRRRSIFQGDAEAARDARSASDGFEHAYLNFGQIRELAGRTRDVTAGYVREAIFDLADVPAELKAPLLAPPYDQPLRSWIDRYVRGTIIGDSDDLAAPDEQHPHLIRTGEIQALSVQPDGTYSFTMNENLRASINDALQFHPKSFEIWGSRAERSSADQSD